MLDVSVIVPARDAQRTLALTLSALEEQDFTGSFEVLVVDNGSHDDTAELARHSPVVARVLERRRGEGPGMARNQGARIASGGVLAFIDADCRPAPAWLSAGVHAIAEADVVQGRVLPDPSTPLGPFDRTLWVTSAYGLFETANLFVTAEVFARTGGFGAGLERSSADGRAGAPFGEDVRFGWRARRMGARTGFCEDAVAYHEVVPRGAGGFVSERLRLSMFPRLAAEIPELRREFFYRRYFLSRRSALFDLAVLGAAASAACRRPTALAAALPYAVEIARHASQWGPRGLEVAVAELLADAVGAGALLAGSIGSRSTLL